LFGDLINTDGEVVVRQEKQRALGFDEEVNQKRGIRL
jgi:hypothetical protein